jgi:flagellar hook-associated protein 3 FlgL
MATQGAGTTSVDGVVAIPGDSFLIESTDKQSLLTTVARISDALKTVKDTPDSKAALAKTISDTLTNFSNAITNIVTVQGDVGARQNMLESSKSLNSDLELSGKEVLSQIQDLDYAEASTRLQMQSFVLSASQQSFVKVSQLSLFTYL